MGFRFWRRMRILPGVSVNLSKSGASLSFGTRGARFTFGPRGPRVTFGVPGTGLFYTATLPQRRDADGRVETAMRNLTLDGLKRLVTPDDEEAFVDGCRRFLEGDEEAALAELLKAADRHPDAACMAGFLLLRRREWVGAERMFRKALEGGDRLGALVSKYRISVTLTFPLTERVSAQVRPDRRGLLLLLAEVLQRQEKSREAMDVLRELLRLTPEDPVVRLSLAEILWETASADRDVLEEIVRLGETGSVETGIHAGLLYYRGMALAALGLHEAAQLTLSAALRRRKVVGEELSRALRYELAKVYEAMGKGAAARREWERLYAEAPDYEDVAVRLGLGNRSRP